ncbi:MAG: ATP-binding protein [Microthrixaceae bacterium]|nr:ATP-binding protein [Microthrixaceae bacterium]
MKVAAVYVRFYRAFNFNFLRKNKDNADPNPWDDYEGMFFPYVKIPLDPEVTSVVGANESGKSQLLYAIECALGAEVAGPDAFCRYSQFFTVDDKLKSPHFGLELVLDESEQSSLSAAFDALVPRRVFVFREQPGQVRIYLGPDSAPIDRASDDPAITTLLPKSFRIHPKNSLPNTVPLDFLVRHADETGTEGDVVNRRARVTVVPEFFAKLGGLRGLVGTAQLKGSDIEPHLPNGTAAAATAEELAQWELAYDLLVTVGGVDPSTFTQLQRAVTEQREGFVSGLVASINRQLSAALNLRRWWSQDEEFEFLVQSKDFDLVFTIKDRTASEYEFSERSDGLRYFLSYLVQYLRHVGIDDPATLLLMDEPDAFLSNQGQQDLLRLFQHFIDRDPGSSRQVVFVTHSPFLIDKNRAYRVRVLDKGVGDEGTRVVRDVSRNHFEPLRSAFGGFRAETAFIGNCNLTVEGPSDQVYLAGMSSDAIRRGATGDEAIDLNQVTLMDAGCASQVPYTVFLVRGRSKKEQPAIVVLLDGDRAGLEAATALQEAYGKPIVDEKYVTTISAAKLPAVSCDRFGGPKDIEDLVTPAVMLEAAARFAEEIGLPGVAVPAVDDLKSYLTTEDISILDAAQLAVSAAGSALHLDKVGMARHVVDVVEDDLHDSEMVRENFRQLFLHLSELTSAAVLERSRTGVGRRVDREIKTFLKDHLHGATRGELRVLLRSVDVLLDSSDEAEAVRTQVRIMQNHHQLHRDLTSPVEAFEDVARKLAAMKYAGVVASEEETEADDERAGVDADEPAAHEDDVSTTPEKASRKAKAGPKASGNHDGSASQPEEAVG